MSQTTQAMHNDPSLASPAWNEEEGPRTLRSIAERIRALGVANFGKVTMELFSCREFDFVSRRFVTGSWGVIMVNDFMVRSFEGMEMDQ